MEIGKDNNTQMVVSVLGTKKGKLPESDAVTSVLHYIKAEKIVCGCKTIFSKPKKTFA